MGTDISPDGGRDPDLTLYTSTPLSPTPLHSIFYTSTFYPYASTSALRGRPTGSKEGQEGRRLSQESLSRIKERIEQVSADREADRTDSRSDRNVDRESLNRIKK